jgi:hypothetical protein
MYVLIIPLEHKNQLYSIRHWENLKLALKENFCYVKDFTDVQIQSVLIKQMTFVKIYLEKEQLLFRINALIPELKMPLGLLWSPIAFSLPLDKIKYNHNFFGIHEKVNLKLVSCSLPQISKAILVEFEALKNYIENAPQVRLQSLYWIRIDEKIIIFGEPLLPIQGKSYWLNHQIYVPNGYTFEYQSLSKIISHSLVNNESIIFYTNFQEYIIIPKEKIKPLTIGSFRLTYQIL